MQKICIKLKPLGLIFLWLSMCALQPSVAQPLSVVTKAGVYKAAVEKDSLQKMVSIAQFIPTATIDLRYATKENFTGKRLYPKGDETFLRLPVARALRAAANELQLLGYQINIWDAYRPYSVTKKMWDLIGDERYVANPAKGSGHNRGLSVDLTLTKNGEEINMGTGFDHFSDTAHHSFSALPADVMANRRLLRTVMEKHGFRALETEWWHYSWPNDRQYEVLDIPAKKLRKAAQ